LNEFGNVLTKLVVIAKEKVLISMYSLGLLIVDLETARRRLLEVFEVPDGKRTNGFRTPPILAACRNPHLDLFAADTGGLSSSLPTPRNRSQGINSPLYAWAAETLQAFYRHSRKWGSCSVN
jgi:hypothetical protein